MSKRNKRRSAKRKRIRNRCEELIKKYISTKYNYSCDTLTDKAEYILEQTKEFVLPRHAELCNKFDILVDKYGEIYDALDKCPTKMLEVLEEVLEHHENVKAEVAKYTNDDKDNPYIFLL